jgi:large subunit ribosomal protein L25
MLHEIEIRCPANLLPDKLEVKINHLELGQAITAGQVAIPNGATLVGSPDDIVVQCTEIVEMAEPDALAEMGPAEPELIGRKAEDEEEPSE